MYWNVHVQFYLHTICTLKFYGGACVCALPFKKQNREFKDMVMHNMEETATSMYQEVRQAPQIKRKFSPVSNTAGILQTCGN